MSYSDLVPHDSLVRVDVTVSHEAMSHGHVAVEQRIRSEIVSRLSHWIYERLDTTLRKAITRFHSPAHMHEGYRLELVVMTKTDFDAMLTKALQMSNPYVSMSGDKTWDQVFANDEPLDAPAKHDPLTPPVDYAKPFEKFGGFSFNKMWFDEKTGDVKKEYVDAVNKIGMPVKIGTVNMPDGSIVDLFKGGKK